MDGGVSNYVKNVSRLFENGRGKIYPKNQLIHYQGDPLSYIYMVKKGFILESGDTRTILLLGKNDIFPLAFSPSMDWNDYKIRYFYQSLTDTELLMLPCDDFKQEIDTDPEMLAIYVNYLSASNEAIMIQLEVMKNKKAIDKVSMLLPYLIEKSGKEIKPGLYELELKLSHQEVADLSGFTRETTTTLIKQLEEEGILDQHKGKWLIDTNSLDKVLAAK
jgi:CRP/FNR family cyclic AMP-dependent transcriptional regulator